MESRSAVLDVRIRNNIVRNSAAGVNVSGTDDIHVSGYTGDVVIENNLFDNIDGNEFNNTGARTLQIVHGPRWRTYQRNTFINVTTSGSTIYMAGPEQAQHLVIRNNLFRKQLYGLTGDVVGQGTVALDTYAPGWVFEDNGFGGASASTHPPNNYYPSQTVGVAAAVPELQRRARRGQLPSRDPERLRQPVRRMQPSGTSACSPALRRTRASR